MPINIHHFERCKQQGKPIVALTAWEFSSAQVLDQCGVDLLLVGDSLAMVALGYTSTLPITLDEILHHAKAVRRAVTQAFLVVDLPFLSYQESPQQAMHSAGRALKEAEAQAVKLEGGHTEIVQTVRYLVQMGVPVMGHIGLTPQSVNQVGGYRKQGTDAESQSRLLNEAKALEEAGAFSIVLEHMPPELAQQISRTLAIPTIGIGAGPHCDGQVLVTHDLLGLSEWRPPFARAYANLRETMTDAVKRFSDDVRERRFPG
ncbi:3-methyl-2-oxobutanoate hydroxymethyltransferase [Leptolyngbya sp. FACHB-261]|uniref:3-methyl-2-oxobutanoate hydroxymethyltransferase n=1 Tax=Leptolyngbya sp. FACHB-261 TaxID=2692806 RepID=UPI001689AC02|nr:3-methyl-2-oxobutanoate hydroxymethyltransferase [Leptolyngbya sp. FACHB-261]MBD2102717.1 3-methyl-2-oxobutanoate hydroxymethyltransferase [Leptolyngbya sp. FACHB-261]